MNPVFPPDRVVAAFGASEDEPQDISDRWDGGIRYGGIVISPIADHARASWSARVRETLDVEGARIARPVRSSDGRYVVSGWRADTFIEGVPEPRFDEVLSMSLRLHRAMETIERPRFVSATPTMPWGEVDRFVVADRAPWELNAVATLGPGVPAEAERRVDVGEALRLVGALATLRRTVDLPVQVVHGDLVGGVLFAGSAPPGIADIVPYWRPPEWAAAVAAVDAVAWCGADEGLFGRWGHLAEWPQMLLRALLFRLGIHVLHPDSRPEAFDGLQAVADRLRPML